MLKPLASPPSPVPALFAFTVVPLNAAPHVIAVAEHTRSFAGAAGGAQLVPIPI